MKVNSDKVLWLSVHDSHEHNDQAKVKELIKALHETRLKVLS